MRRIIFVLLLLCLVFSFTACKDNAAEDPTAQTTIQSTTAPAVSDDKPASVPVSASILDPDVSSILLHYFQENGEPVSIEKILGGLENEISGDSRARLQIPAGDGIYVSYNQCSWFAHSAYPGELWVRSDMVGALSFLIHYNLNEGIMNCVMDITLVDNNTNEPQKWVYTGSTDLTSYQDSTQIIPDRLYIESQAFSSEETGEFMHKEMTKNMTSMSLYVRDQLKLLWENIAIESTNLSGELSELGFGIDFLPVVAPPASGGSFTNKFGDSTTKCVISGCNNYIASSGDTNCCTSHSNNCLNCGCYIDGDAMYCMSCLSGHINPNSSSNSSYASSGSSGKKCEFKDSSGKQSCSSKPISGGTLCQYHLDYLSSIYDNLVG